LPEPKRPKGPLTIYDVASRAGVSIASVSRVLNGQGSPRAATRERVLKAVSELGFVPDGAARALSNGLKEVVGVVFRRGDETPFPDEDESFLFIDVIYRGIDLAARRRGFDVLMGSVGFNDGNVASRVAAVAGKADGLILHDRMVSAAAITRLTSMVPVVTLAGTPVRGAMNVRCDNATGMRDLVRHLVVDHGYRTLGYLAGRSDSPDNHARAKSIAAEARANGATVEIGDGWRNADLFGSQVHDPMGRAGGGITRDTNHAGGLEGGVTNGMPVVCRAAMKPIATLKKALPSADVLTKEPFDAAHERSDVCAVAAASIVGEAMVAITLAEAFLEKFGGDSIRELVRNVEGYRAQLLAY